jgi:hypothetical protein
VSRIIRSAFHLEPGDKVEFSIVTRYTDHEVVETTEDERGVKYITLLSPTGNTRKFPVVHLQDVEAEVEQ